MSGVCPAARFSQCFATTEPLLALASNGAIRRADATTHRDLRDVERGRSIGVNLIGVDLMIMAFRRLSNCTARARGAVRHSAVIRNE